MNQMIMKKSWLVNVPAFFVGVVCVFLRFFRRASEKAKERHKTETARSPNLHVPHKGQ